MDIGKGLSQSFEVYKNNAVTLIVAALVTCILSACFIITGPLMAGFLMLCTKLNRGEKAEIGEIFAYFDKLVPTLVLTLMIFIPVCIIAFIPILGTLVLIVLGPAAYLVYTCGLLSIINENLAPVDALKKGIALLQTNMVNNWIYSLVMSIVSGICSFITMPIGATGMVIAYEELNGSSAAPSNNVTPSV